MVDRRILVEINVECHGQKKILCGDDLKGGEYVSAQTILSNCSYAYPICINSSVRYRQATATNIENKNTLKVSSIHRQA